MNSLLHFYFFTGYLVSSLLLNDTDELMVMHMNTLVKDLESSDFIVVNMALIALPHLVPQNLMDMVLPKLFSKTTHTRVRWISRFDLVVSHCISFSLAGFHP